MMGINFDHFHLLFIDCLVVITLFLNQIFQDHQSSSGKFVLLFTITEAKFNITKAFNPKPLGLF